MKYKHVPKELEVSQDGGDWLVRYDYDPGEDQWFDARQGVGSPGHPPSLEITEVKWRGDWVAPNAVPLFSVELAEQSVMDAIDAEKDAFWAAYDESRIGR